MIKITATSVNNSVLFMVSILVYIYIYIYIYIYTTCSSYCYGINRGCSVWYGFHEVLKFIPEYIYPGLVPR